MADRVEGVQAAPAASMLLVRAAVLSALSATAVSQSPAATPPAQPPFASPGATFPTAWFGANPQGLDYQDPKQLDSMRGYRAVFVSWPEMMMEANWTNGTEVSERKPLTSPTHPP